MCFSQVFYNVLESSAVTEKRKSRSTWGGLCMESVEEEMTSLHTMIVHSSCSFVEWVTGEAISVVDISFDSSHIFKTQSPIGRSERIYHYYDFSSSQYEISFRMHFTSVLHSFCRIPTLWKSGLSLLFKKCAYSLSSLYLISSNHLVSRFHSATFVFKTCYIASSSALMYVLLELYYSRCLQRIYQRWP